MTEDVIPRVTTGLNSVLSNKDKQKLCFTIVVHSTCLANLGALKALTKLLNWKPLQNLSTEGWLKFTLPVYKLVAKHVESGIGENDKDLKDYKDEHQVGIDPPSDFVARVRGFGVHLVELDQL